MRTLDEIQLRSTTAFKGEIFGVAGLSNSQWVLLEYLPFDKVSDSVKAIYLDQKGFTLEQLESTWNARYKRKWRPKRLDRKLNKELSGILLQAILTIDEKENLLLGASFLSKAVVYDWLLGFDTTELEDKLYEVKVLLASDPQFLDESFADKDISEQTNLKNDHLLKVETALHEAFLLVQGGRRYIHNGDTRPKW